MVELMKCQADTICQPSMLSHPEPLRPRHRAKSRLFSTLCGATAGLLVFLPFGAASAQLNPGSTLLYSLETDCSVKDVENRCKVEAFDGLDTTVYRTTVNSDRISFRLVDRNELRGAQIWDQASKSWRGLDRLSLNFKANELCINGRELCLINPNYFASLREDYPYLRADLIVARFDLKDGRLAAICYSQEACDAGF